jgi:hypothetical protein
MRAEPNSPRQISTLPAVPFRPMRRVFVSHSTSDDSYVAEMESFLRAAGFDEVFNDVSAIRRERQKVGGRDLSSLERWLKHPHSNA